MTEPTPEWELPSVGIYVEKGTRYTAVIEALVRRVWPDVRSVVWSATLNEHITPELRFPHLSAAKACDELLRAIGCELVHDGKSVTLRRQGERDAAGDDVQSLNQTLSRIQAERDELSVELDATKELLDQLHGDRDEARDARRQVAEENRQLIQERNEIQRVLSDKIAELRRYIPKLAKAEGERDEARKALREAGEENDRLKVEVYNLRCEKAGVEGQRDAGDDFERTVREALGVADEPGWGLEVRDRIESLKVGDVSPADAEKWERAAGAGFNSFTDGLVSWSSYSERKGKADWRRAVHAIARELGVPGAEEAGDAN